MAVDSIVSKYKTAIEVYKKEGKVSLVWAIWRFLTRPLRFSFLFQFLKWLRYGKMILPSQNSYIIVDLLHQTEFYTPDVDSVEKSTDAKMKQYEDGYFSDEFFTSIEPDDTVVEIGAYIGCSTQIAAKRAEQVYALEPVTKNRFCLKKNMTDYDNVTVLPYAAGDCNRTEIINIGKNGAKSTILSLDWSSNQTREVVDTEKIKVKRLEKICEEIGLEEIDFLKLEAEGLEPEVLNGVGDVEINKLVVNCSEEREGETPKPEIISYLKDNCYDIYEASQYLIYAKKNK
jgi:FkbM family methyltransferase